MQTHSRPSACGPSTSQQLFSMCWGRKERLFMLAPLCVAFPFPPAHSLPPRFLSPDSQRVTLPWQPAFWRYSGSPVRRCDSFTARVRRTMFRQSLLLSRTFANFPAADRNGSSVEVQKRYRTNGRGMMLLKSTNVNIGVQMCVSVCRVY